MSIAAAASHSRAHHAEGAVANLFHVLRRDRLPEAWPAGAGIELGAGVKKRRAAADAAIQTLVMLVPVLTGESHLRAVMAGNFESAGRELLLPLAFALHDLGHVNRTRALSGIGE